MDKSAGFWIFEALRNFAKFSGRSRRREYWWFEVFSGIVVLALLVTDAVVFGRDVNEYDFGPMSALAVLFFVIPSLSVSVRRLHDVDRTGWWVLMAPTFIGSLVLFYWYVSSGTPGDNRFGPDPKAGER